MKTKYVSTDKTVSKRVIKHGKISNKPEEGSVVHLHIEDIQILPPKSVDIDQLNSEILTGRPDIVFTIDEVNSEIDRQIERAVKWMGENEQAYIRIILQSMTKNLDSNVDNMPAVKFKATLSKHEPHKPIWKWTPEEKYEKAAKYKDIAVKLVHNDRIKDAFYRFSKAVKIIITLEPIDDWELEESLYNKIYDLRTSIYNNMAMCQLKLNNYDHAISLCNKVLIRDKNNVKAFYRRGCASGANKNVDRALNDFQKAIHVQPTNTAAWEKMKIYSEMCIEASKRSDQLLKKMFKI